MNTPICDFAQAYAQSDPLRLHVPGHKGMEYLGLEKLDITEIDGADSLYEASGIIARSEENASHLFDCPTFYSTEGSSHCIRSMLYLAGMDARKAGKKPLIAAARNVHKSFLSAVALLDYDVAWLYPQEAESYLSCQVSPEALEELLKKEPVTAVYITSPDYLGGLSDISALAQTAHRHGCLLLVDNAHGAYLRFLAPSMHPMDLGADLACGSAHKTLPVLTGGAYLHTTEILADQAKNALALFGSTSPSYLILQSLDAANPILSTTYPGAIDELAQAVGAMKQRLSQFRFIGDEPLKLTIATAPYGYTGSEMAQILRDQGMEAEFADPDHLVLMVSPETGIHGLHQLESALTATEQRPPLHSEAPPYHVPEKVLSIREATLHPSQVLPVHQCLNRILASATVGCPPAVPIAVCGERIDNEILERFRYYGIDTCYVVTK